METFVIDLGKQVIVNLPQLISSSFRPNQQNQTLKLTQITYQLSKPINFFIYRDLVLSEIKLKKIQMQFNLQSQHIIPYMEDFYLENQDPIKFFELFLTFLYTGRVEYRTREHYLPLLKLAIYFQCDLLIDCLINQQKYQGIIRTFFLNFLCDIFNDKNYLQTLLSNSNSQKFLQAIILQNSPNIFSHTEWHIHKKREAQEKIKKAFSQIDPKLFVEFANVYTKNNPQNIIYFNQLLYFIEMYENPQLQIMEDIYLGRMFDQIDEEYFNAYDKWFTQRCKNIIEKQINKILSQPFHMQHSQACDLVNKSFKATCSHQICLNCFYQYLHYRSKFKRQDINVPQKIRCFTRFINKDICDCVFQDQDFLVLKDFEINELLNLYLKQKI